MPAASEAFRKLLYPEVGHMFYWGSWSQFTGFSAVPGCIGSREDVASDLCFLTAWWQQGQTSHPSMRLETAATAHTTSRSHVGSALPSVSAWSWKLLGWYNPLLSHPKTIISCLFGKPRLFPGLPHLCPISPFRLSSWQSIPVLSLGSDLRSVNLNS